MKISSRRIDGVVIVDMTGRLDAAAAGDGNDQLAQIIQGGQHNILVNLEQLEFISSAGLRVLLLAAKLLQQSGGKLKLCSANTLVKDVLEMSGFTSLISLYATEGDAVASFR
jgi:anti-sigma B factor antagonist